MKRCPTCNRLETDEALKFCRVEGATLVSDSSAIGAEARTAQLSSGLDASEAHTSVLPHNTNANVNRATATTTVLAPQSLRSTTGEVGIAKKEKFIGMHSGASRPGNAWDSALSYG